MTSLIPLCPPHPKILERLQGRKIAIRLDSIDTLDEVVALNQQYSNHLHCLVIISRLSVADLEFNQEHWHLPLALFAPKLGQFHVLAPKLQTLKKLNIRIYLPLDCEENFSALRILSSLGIASAAVFQDVGIDWERASDLMTYALLGRAPRAPIEPFTYLAERYSPNIRNNFSAVYFDDPGRYVHVDAAGRIALSFRELADRKFISARIEDLGSLSKNSEYLDRLESWRLFFLQDEGCAFCEAWRICLGKFGEYRKDHGGCSAFFKEFLEAIEVYQSIKNNQAIEVYQSIKNNKVELWQP